MKYFFAVIASIGGIQIFQFEGINAIWFSMMFVGGLATIDYMVNP